MKKHFGEADVKQTGEGQDGKHRFMMRLMVGLALLAAVALAGLGGRALLAAIEGSANIPERMNYQGTLATSSGPYTGTTQIVFALYDMESGGASLWQETHSGVSVSNGFFSVVLGSQGQPLTPSLFDGAERWLQMSADLGAGPVTFPRQRLYSVPYAFQAYHAAHAQLAETANMALNPAPGSAYQNVVIVAKSGGDYTSVASALASISGATSSNQYLVWVAPGVYEETAISAVPAYVHLQGAGRTITKIVGNRSAQFPNTADANIVQLSNYSQLSDLTVENTATTLNASAILVSPGATLATRIDNVDARTTSTGGTVHVAIQLNEGVATIRDSSFTAAGANTFNQALSSYLPNSAGMAITSEITGSIFRGEGNNGYGMSLINSAPTIKDSEIYGGYRGIWTDGNYGVTLVKDSYVWVQLIGGGLPDYALFEMNNGAGLHVFGSQLSFNIGDDNTRYRGNNLLACLDNYIRHPFFPHVINDLQNGSTSATACKVSP